MKTRLLLLISRFLDGGIDTVLLEYLRNLSPDKFSITLAIGIKLNELEVFIHQIPPHIKLVYLVDSPILTSLLKRKITRRLPFPYKAFDAISLSPLRRFQTGRRLRSLLKEHDTVIDFDCMFYSFLQNTPVWKAAFFHFSFAQSYKNTPRRIRRIGKKLEQYDRIILLSDQMEEEGFALFPALRNKFIRIYNSFDPRKLLLRAKEIPDDELLHSNYLLSVARLEESQKDLSTLIHAYHILKQEYHIPHKLLIIGEGKSRAQLLQLTEELGLSEDILFLGFITNPYPWIHQCRMLVHSSKFEGLPTILIEALLLGKPIVATDCPTGPREILANGKAGMLTPVGDSKALADAIQQILENPTLEKQILSEAEKQKELFKIKNNIKIVEELCEKPVH